MRDFSIPYGLKDRIRQYRQHIRLLQQVTLEVEKQLHFHKKDNFAQGRI